jgi:DNA polymerase III subunit epsilon
MVELTFPPRCSPAASSTPPIPRPPVLATQTVLDLWEAVGPAAEHPPPWHEGPLATFDLETTGVDPARARILEVALHLDLPAAAARPLVDTLVDPGPEVAIPAAATAVHGISRRRLEAARAPDTATVVRRLCRTLAGLAADGIPVVIYNACYDWPLLAAELRRLDPRMRLPACHLVDPLVLDRYCDRYREGKRTLAAACAVYGVALDGAHRAGADCIASVAVARAIGRRYPQVGSLSPLGLHGLQVAAFEAWRTSVNAHLLATGADRPPIRAGWPARN